MDNVRTEEYKKQQQAVVALHNTISSNPYYSRAVMSIVMQVHAISILYIGPDYRKGLKHVLSILQL